MSFKLSLCAGLAALTLLSFTQPLFAGKQILLPNDGFEDGLQGWTVNASNPNVAKVMPEAASLGKLGLRIQSTPDCLKYNVTSPPIPATPGKSYTVSFWCGGGGNDAGANLVAEILFMGEKHNLLKPALASIRKWPLIQVRGGVHTGNPTLAAAAPEGAVSMTVCIRPANPAAPSGAMDVDDFSITELEAPSPTPTSSGTSAASPPAAAFHPIPAFDPVRLQTLLDDIKRDPYRGKNPPKIVIKLDDLRPTNGGVHPRWTKVADFAKSKDIKVAFGIIANSMEADSPNFFKWVKEKNTSGMIEFWNHGYDHAQASVSLMEFSGQPYEHQKEHMTKANQLAREKLGFPFVSFGAPFNATDKSTIQVLSEDPDIKVWMYGDTKNTAGKVVLDRCIVTLETPTLIPNYAAFIEGYAHNRGGEYFVMQGHPAGWSDDRYEQFTKIVDFLISQKADFVLPRDFLNSGKPETK